MASAEIAASKYKEALLKQLWIGENPGKVKQELRNKMVQGSPGKGSYGNDNRNLLRW